MASSAFHCLVLGVGDVSLVLAVQHKSEKDLHGN